MAVNWSDGNTTDYGYTSYDWFLTSGTPGPNSGVAIAGLDRANRGTGCPEGSTANPVLFYYDIDLSGDANYVGRRPHGQRHGHPADGRYRAR